jgi:hypothetical protein
VKPNRSQSSNDLLRGGDMKQIRMAALVIVVVSLITVPLSAETAKGDIGSVGMNFIVLTTKEGFDVNSTTVIYVDGKLAGIKALQAGMAAVVEYALCKSTTGYPCASSINATSSTTSSTTSGTTAKGEVGKVGTSAFFLTDGQAFNVLSSTVVTIDGAQATYSSLAPGMKAVIEYSRCKSRTGYPCATSIQATK